MSRSWQAGERLLHRDNPELGAGRVLQVQGRTLLVEFPQDGTRLRLSSASDALQPLELTVGDRVRADGSEGETRIEERLDDGRFRLQSGEIVDGSALWPAAGTGTLVDRLAAGDIDHLDDFANRLDALHLLAAREADGLGSFLGGRIRLFPHQLHVAGKATRTDPVRWLLADEVGLGKTVEACLILNHLVHTGRAERVLVVAPETLTVQWLGELWRKYHQVFVLLDEARLADVKRDFGTGFNPFDVHRRGIVSHELLVQQPRLAEQAVAAGIDLLVVDEAHHLRRPPGHPGNPAYRAVLPMARADRHMLLLTATPLEEDTHGFLRLVQLLRPDVFPEAEQDLTAALEEGRPLPACVSSTRRKDVGGLPPRRHAPADIDAPDGWAALHALELHLRAAPANGPMALREKIRRIRRGLTSPATLRPMLDQGDRRGLQLAALAAQADPRPEWLADAARQWKDAGEKSLVFVENRDVLEWLRPEIERRARLRSGVFHEDLSPGQRDIEVAQFRLPDGPSLLFSTECGGEGRNFEFCRRVVLYDLPWNPMAVEQRIGRLDRIGRSEDVEIVSFVPPHGLAAQVARVMADLGLFREPLGGYDRELAPVAATLEETAARVLPDAAAAPGGDDETAGELEARVTEVRRARRRVQASPHRRLYVDPYRPEHAGEILSRIPDDLDDLTEETITAAAERLGFDIEEQRGERVWSVHYGPRVAADDVPGVAQGSSFLGTFGREEGVERETLDYFASGHPLVEGLLGALEDSPRGRVALLHLPTGSPPGVGLLALYREGSGFTGEAVDVQGRSRPEWAALLTRRPLRSRRVAPDEWTGRPGWRPLVSRLAAALPTCRDPVALALFRVGSGEKRAS